MSDAPSAPSRKPLSKQGLTGQEMIQFANLMIHLKGPVVLTASYRNYRGETATRTFTPISVRFGQTTWHPEPCLLMKVFDHDKGAERDYAMDDIEMHTLKVAT